MARGDIVGVKTNSGSVPAVVLAMYDSNGDALAHSTALSGTVDTVDVFRLGVDASRREGVTYNHAAENNSAVDVDEAFTYNTDLE